MDKKNKIFKIIDPAATYNIQNKALCFLDGDRIPSSKNEKTLLNIVKAITKKYGKLYYHLVHIFSPVKPSNAYKRVQRQLLERYIESNVILNIGSGPQYYCGRKDIINVDLFAFDEVDIVADAASLPIVSESVDLVISTALLEHLEEPATAIGEMHRILAPGGSFLCYIPFIAPFHEAPNDFFRWSKQGSKIAFKGFNKVKVGIGVGPTSGMLWVSQEWFATAFSLGSIWVHDILLILIMLLTAPIKLLDILLERSPIADKVSSGFYVFGSK